MSLLRKFRIFNYFKKAVSLDLRSLALLRIGIGVTIILDLITRFPDLVAFYTNEGILPVTDFFSYTGNIPWVFSFHALSGDQWFQTLLFAVEIIFAFCLVIGWHTRLFTLLSFLFLTSLDNRNTLILNNGDLQLRLILFWAIFLPLGKKYSFDALKNKSASDIFYGPASAAYYIQIFCIYFFAGLHKLFSPVWQQGQGLFLALSQESTATPAAAALRSYPDLLYWPNFSVILLEIFCPIILLFSPSVKIKSVVLCLLIFLQASFFVFLSLGFFPWISLICLLGLLPGNFWELKKVKEITKFLYFQQMKLHTPSLTLSNGQGEPKKHSSTANDLPQSRQHLSVYKIILNSSIIFLVFVTLWTNLSTVKLSGNILPQLIAIAKYLQIYQSWGMFSTFPDEDKGYYTLNGTLKNGETVDLFQNQPWQNYTPRPHSGYHTYNRWSVFFLHYLKNPWHTRHFAGYLCNKYNYLAKNNPLDNIGISYTREAQVTNIGLYYCSP